MCRFNVPAQLALTGYWIAAREKGADL